MKIISKLKSVLSGNKKEKQDEKMPGRMVVSRFKDSAMRSQLSGNRQKEVAVVERGKERKVTLPYSREIVEAYRSEANMPVYPEDGNSDAPGADVLDEYDPGTISWDDY